MPDPDPTLVSLEHALALATAELSEARAAVGAARRATIAAQELNRALLAERGTVPDDSIEHLQRRSDELDLVYATRLWRWSTGPRRVYGSIRKLVFRSSERSTR